MSEFGDFGEDDDGRETGRVEVTLDNVALYNVETEAALLGAMFIENKLIDRVRELLQPSDFYEGIHYRLYELIIRFHDEGKLATPVTLRPFVENDPRFKEIGGAGYMAQICGSGAGLVGWRQFSQQIAEFGRLRAIRDATASMVQQYLDGDTSLSTVTAGVDEALARAVFFEKPVKTHTAAGMIAKVKERSQRITDAALNSVGPTCRTVSDMNALLGPLEPGTYVILAGRPGMGKTTLASSAAWGYAANGHPTAYFAAEGTEDTLAMRLTSDLSLENGVPIPHDAIKRDKLAPEQRHRIDTLEQEAALLPIDYQVIDRTDVRRLRSYVSRAAAKWKAKGRKLEVVFVDYLQLLSASVNGRDIDDDRKRVNAVSAALLQIAKDFDLTLFALSQLNRGLESRPDKRPQVSDLRESGRLEEDADAIMLLYREEYYLENEKPQEGSKNYREELEDWDIRLSRARDRVDLILGKNRHGERKVRTAKFFGKFYAIRGGDYAFDNFEQMTAML